MAFYNTLSIVLARHRLTHSPNRVGPILEVVCEDVDELSGADFMGTLAFPSVFGEWVRLDGVGSRSKRVASLS